MPYFVYILKSKKTNKHYVGFTNNLEERLKYHNGGKTKSLIKHIPLHNARYILDSMKP